MLLYSVVVGAIIFFGLTRTDVGRDGLRAQIETQFNQRFEGSLSIGHLRGNLVNDLFASDVTVRDASGRAVASVDSIVVRPRWLQLLGRELSARSIELYEPHVTAHRDASGKWSIRSAFRRTSPSSSSRNIDLTAASVDVINGRVTTTRDGDAPARVRSGWLFDYTRTRIRNIDARVTVDWTEAQKLVEVYGVSFDVPELFLAVTSLQGQVAREDDSWALRQTRFATGDTDIRLSGTLSDLGTPEPNIDVTLAESQIDLDELRRAMPRLPLQRRISVQGRVIGPLSSFLLDEFEVRHGESSIAIKGTALGLPDSLDYDIEVDNSRIRREDIASVWRGELPERLSAIDEADVSLFSRGVIDLSGDLSGQKRSSFDVSASVIANTSAGRARGDVAAQRKRNRAVQYSAELDLDSLNLAAVTGRERLAGAVSGQLSVVGRGIVPDSLDSDISMRLSPSVIGEQRLDTAHVEVTLTGRDGRGSVLLRQAGGGELIANGRVDLNTGTPVYQLTTSTTNFDLAPLPGRAPETRLNTSFEARGTGLRWTDATGDFTLRVDSSQIAAQDTLRLLRPHDLAVQLRNPDGSTGRTPPNVRVDGSVVQLVARGDVRSAALPAVARLWSQEVIDMLREEADKPMSEAMAAASITAQSGPTPVQMLAASLSTEEDAEEEPDTLRGPRMPRDAVRARLADAGSTGGLSGRVDLTIRAPDILRQWLPALPPLAENLAASLRFTAGADSMSVQSEVSSPTYAVSGLDVHAPTATLRADASLDRPLTQSITTDLTVRADSASMGALRLAAPRLLFSFDEREGMLRVDTERKGKSGPYLVEASLDLLPSRNVITVEQLSAHIGEIVWSTNEPSTIDLYADAVVVEPLIATSNSPRGGQQQIRLSGTLSPAEEDVLVADIDNVLLYPVSDLLNLKRPVAGRLDGSVELSGRWRQPLLRSNLTMGRFSVDRRLLGAFELSATYDTQTPDVIFSLNVSPDSTTPAASLVPNGIRAVEPSTLSLSGRVRLPVAGADTLDGDPLDLNLDVERADLFFFEYIFDTTITRVEGYTAGKAHIGGSFTDPLFDADMRVDDGRFTLPDFNLNYTIAGDVRVDEAGIHMAGVRVEDETNGIADIDGSLLFNDYKFFSFDLTGQLREILVIDVKDSDNLPFYGTIRASGPATLTGPLPDATLRSPSARTTPESELYIPVLEEDVTEESGYIIFADSTGALPDLTDLTKRDNLLADRPVGEPSFLDGLELDLNIEAPEGSTVHLVFDPLVGDVVTAIGSGRVQLQRQEGEFFVYGSYEVQGGDYLFTAGEVFVRRFNIESGTLTWDGDPVNANMDISAAYRTRASPAGLPNEEQYAGRIPMIVELDITGRVETPRVDLSLSIARDQRSGLVGDQTLDAILNQDDLATEYATSVLLTNTFLLTTSTLTASGGTSNDQSRIAEAGNQLAFNSVSQLVASQLNRYLSEALPNVDVNLGVSGEDPEDLDIIYGVALRLLNERLIIRGEGVYTGNEPDQAEVGGPQGEFVVEVRLSRGVSLEVFYRRAGDDVTRQTLTNTTGAGLSYQTEFSTWKQLFYRLFGWLIGEPDDEPRREDPPESEEESGETLAGEG